MCVSRVGHTAVEMDLRCKAYSPRTSLTHTLSLTLTLLGFCSPPLPPLSLIPTRICVAIPVYYSTGSRMKGFLWALLSGVSEPVAAVLGYLVLMNVVGPVAYGVLFGMVAGMMVYICLRELIPTAHRYGNDGQRARRGRGRCGDAREWSAVVCVGGAYTDIFSRHRYCTTIVLPLFR